jgi:hypothetical protein
MEVSPYTTVFDNYIFPEAGFIYIKVTTDSSEILCSPEIDLLKGLR